MMIPAISVKQPWASMIASGAKTIETRTWTTGYRGPLVICSSATPKGQGVTRRALCVVFLKHCRVMTPADRDAARCEVYDRANAWEFAPDKRIPLMAAENVRGQLGIFPLSLPESEFFTPEDRLLAYRWLDWAKDKGMLDRIQSHTVNERS
jgi:hypothetical protein